MTDADRAREIVRTADIDKDWTAASADAARRLELAIVSALRSTRTAALEEAEKIARNPSSRNYPDGHEASWAVWPENIATAIMAADK